MELRQLKYFVAVAEAQSYVGAGERLNMHPGALRKQICSLEEEIGVPLLKRAGDGVEMTTEGQCFLTRSREIISYCAESVAALQGTEA